MIFVSGVFPQKIVVGAFAPTLGLFNAWATPNAANGELTMPTCADR